MIARVFTCADCRREGVDAPQSIDAYYIWHERATGRAHRSVRCKRHDNARAAARLRAKLDPQSPHYNAQLHERQKKAKRESMQRARAAHKEAKNNVN